MIYEHYENKYKINYSNNNVNELKSESEDMLFVNQKEEEENNNKEEIEEDSEDENELKKEIIVNNIVENIDLYNNINNNDNINSSKNYNSEIENKNFSNSPNKNKNNNNNNRIILISNKINYQRNFSNNLLLYKNNINSFNNSNKLNLKKLLNNSIYQISNRTIISKSNSLKKKLNSLDNNNIIEVENEILNKLHNLKLKKKSISCQLKKIALKKNYFESLSFLNVSSCENNKNINKIKQYKNELNILLEKLKAIENEENKIVNKNIKNDRKKNLNDFLSDDSIIDNYICRLEEIKKEKKFLQKLMENDLKKSIEKKNKILDENEKEVKKQKEKKLFEMKIKAKKLFQKFYEKRKKMADLINNSKNYSSFLNNSTDNILFIKLKKQFEEKEKKINLKQKILNIINFNNKSNNKETLKEFNYRILTNKIKLKKRQNDYDNNLLDLYKNNSLSFPKFQSYFYNKIKEEEKKIKENKEKEIFKKNFLFKEKKNYSKLKIPKPKISFKLQIESLNKLKKYNSFRNKNINNIYKI